MKSTDPRRDDLVARLRASADAGFLEPVIQFEQGSANPVDASSVTATGFEEDSVLGASGGDRRFQSAPRADN